MAAPVADSYRAASGQRVRAGITTSLPAWRTQMAARTWAEIALGPRLTDVDPTYDDQVNPLTPPDSPWRITTPQIAVVQSWNGAQWDEANKQLMVWGGGHANWAGNELYRWRAVHGYFERVTNPTGSIGNTGVLNDGNESSAVYFDGQPRAFHTYNNLAVRNGEIWAFGGSVSWTGFAASRPFRFDAALNRWVREIDVSIGTTFGGVCYDSNRDVFWIVLKNNSRPNIYDPVAKTVTTHPRYVPNGKYKKPIYDPVRDCVIVFADQSIFVLDPDDGADAAPAPMTGPLPTIGDWGIMGVQYDDARDRYLAWDGNNHIFVLTPPAQGLDPKSNTWTWSILNPAAENTVNAPPRQTNGTYGRFWYSRSLNCVGICSSTLNHMFVFALED